MYQKPARILYVSTVSDIVGGELITLFDLMSKIDRNIYQPILLCPGPGILTQRCQERQIETIFLPGLPSHGAQARQNIKRLLPNALEVQKIIKSKKIDLIHANSTRAAYHTGLAARWAGIPHVIHVREIYRLPFYSPLKARFLDFISDQIIAVSKATQEAITSRRKALAQKVEVVYDGLLSIPEFNRAQVKALRNEFGMLDYFPLMAVIGALHPLKGQEVIVKAMPSILARYPKALCLIVGSPLGEEGKKYQAYLTALIKKNGISDHVVFTGFRQDVPLMMASIDLLLHTPVLPDALPHVLIEASAQNCLMVASNIGGIGEVILDQVTGRLVPVNQPKALAEVVLYLFDHPDYATLLRHTAGERVKTDFSIERHINQIQEIYKRLLLIHAYRP